MTFYFDKSDLDATFEKLKRVVNEMDELKLISHEQMNTIDELMSEWGKENLAYYSDVLMEYESLPEDQQLDEDDLNFELRNRRWYLETPAFSQLDDKGKINYIQVYQEIVRRCLINPDLDYDDLPREYFE